MVCGMRGEECGQYNATKREKNIFVSMNRDKVSKTKAQLTSLTV